MRRRLPAAVVLLVAAAAGCGGTASGTLRAVGTVDVALADVGGLGAEQRSVLDADLRSVRTDLATLVELCERLDPDSIGEVVGATVAPGRVDGTQCTWAVGDGPAGSSDGRRGLVAVAIDDGHGRTGFDDTRLAISEREGVDALPEAAFFVPGTSSLFFLLDGASVSVQVVLEPRPDPDAARAQTTALGLRLVAGGSLASGE